MLSEKLKSIIREVPDFPKPGISFKDITPLLLHSELYLEIVEGLLSPFRDLKIDAVTAIESRGFLFGPAMANQLNVPFIPIRKAGKLPRTTLSASYALEYGEATIEVHAEDIKEGSHLLIHDDLLATGGTTLAATELISKSKAHVAGFSFIVELDFLEARQKLSHLGKCSSLLHY
jgi:adenine phosphoribosyltransferase